MEYINEPVDVNETNYLSFCGIPCDGKDKNCSGCHNKVCNPMCGEDKGPQGWWCIEVKEDV